MLEENNLLLNNDKTEEHRIGKEGEDESWKKCKFLGSIINTEEDIRRRKGITIGVYKQLDHIFKSRKIGNELKIRSFKTYICSVFLYNSELWTLTKKLEEDIDIFQRKQLRKILGIYWPKKISNENLYDRTKVEPWSRTIRRRRLKWFGHMMRLQTETPAQKALQQYIKSVSKPVGRPKQTWIYNLYTDIKEHSDLINVNFKNEQTFINNMYEICRDNRAKWNKTIEYMTLQ